MKPVSFTHSTGAEEDTIWFMGLNILLLLPILLQHSSTPFPNAQKK
jgi:hypothetical protein